MSRLLLIPLVLLLALSGAGRAADLTKIDRRIAKEPAYRSKSPRYALLVIGPEGRDRVWLVKDGDTLYVDRNGNGDLTEAGEKIEAKKGPGVEDAQNFEVAELAVGGKKHYRLFATAAPLKQLVFGDNATRRETRAALTKDPEAIGLLFSFQMEAPHLRKKGLVTVTAGVCDLNGPLVMAAKAADAPIIHCGGPLEVTFYAERPALRINRSTECVLCVGTPGLGAGTLAMIGYDETIPSDTHPKANFVFPSATPGPPPLKILHELKQRC